MLDAVLNELSWVHDGTRQEARRLLVDFVHVLLELRRCVGPLRLRQPDSFRKWPLGEGYSLAQFLRDPHVPKDKQREGLSALANRGPLLDDAEAARFARTWLERHGSVEALSSDGHHAEGLLAAHLLDGVCVSLAVDRRWDSSRVTLQIQQLSGEPPSLVQRTVTVRHAARVAHVDDLADWLRKRELDPERGRLRREVDLSLCQFVSASMYRGGKHVQGSTNAQRRTHACRYEEGGRCNGQFVAINPDDETVVDDQAISAWERRVLEEALEGLHEVRRHGSAFHVYAHVDHIVGYVGETGEETSLLRVEWSSNEVHSHPRA